MKEQINIRRCENGNCNGGQAFRIRDKLFCSPMCGNIYFNLTPRDKDYWPSLEKRTK